jgi:hypothetical protein
LPANISIRGEAGANGKRAARKSREFWNTLKRLQYL